MQLEAGEEVRGGKVVCSESDQRDESIIRAGTTNWRTG
jgi:hypothetical protein